MHEWPLVIFTLLMQMSIGCVLATLINYRTILIKLPPNRALTAIHRPLICAFILGSLGLIGSLFHLGNPLHGIYTLLNVTHSWMSCEVVFTGMYMALLFISLSILLIKRIVPNGLLIATAIVGLIDIYAMSAIYDNTMFNFWRGIFTYSAFYGSSLLLGGIATCYLLVTAIKTTASQSQNEIKSVLRLSLIVCITGVFLLLLSLISLLNQPEAVTMLSISPKSLPDNIVGMSFVRIVLISLGIGLIALLLRSSANNPRNGLYLSLSMGCIITAELLGRYVFFDFIT